MAPFWAQAIAAEPSTNNKTAASAANDEPIVSRNNRDIFKISSSGKSRPYILLNPEASEKLYGMVGGIIFGGAVSPQRLKPRLKRITYRSGEPLRHPRASTTVGNRCATPPTNQVQGFLFAHPAGAFFGSLLGLEREVRSNLTKGRQLFLPSMIVPTQF
jgi:hypothetical protein